MPLTEEELDDIECRIMEAINSSDYMQEGCRVRALSISTMRDIKFREEKKCPCQKKSYQD